ncbi:MAG: HupE/UreJ family protein, partial [Pseudomonadota bacterium]
MQVAFSKLTRMLALIVLLSSVIVRMSSPAMAHEVSPTVGDITVADGRVELSLRITLESFLAGIDLDIATDTNDVPQAADYDTLRALAPQELAERVRSSGMVAPIVLEVDGATREWALRSLDIPEVGDAELPRVSQMVLETEVTGNASGFRLLWPDGYGTLILRQISPDAPYTGYISGGE